MKATVEPLEGNKVKLSVEVDEGEFEQALDAAFRKIAHEVRIPGFRPGKAPRKLLEARMGKDTARQEAIREALPEYYAEAVKTTELDPIAPPEIDITSAEQGPVSFDAVVEVRPQVAIPGYGGLQVTVPSPEVADEEVDRQIDRLRERDADLRPVDRPAADRDVVTVDITGGEQTLDDYSYVVGSASIVPELDDQLRGAKVGDILSFEATPAGSEEALSFRVLLKDVKESVLPELTDEWAGEASEFETVEELRADTRTRLATVKKLQASLAMRDEALKALVELVEDEAPEALVTEEMERRARDLSHRLEHQGASIAQYLEATGTSEEDFVAQLRVDAVESVKADLALRALAEAERLEADEDDVDNEVARLAERFDTKPDRLRRDLERQDALPTVRSDIKKAKALEWLVQHVEVVDEEGRPIDRAELSPQADVLETSEEPAE
ncbi:MAG TPA: trigger factor [Acidimicrobiales bacterium]|jgi:trigger factor|nr:trigger factor [Acidimicrobiales bacterium]